MPDGITTKIARSFGVLSLLVLPIGSVGQTIPLHFAGEIRKGLFNPFLAGCDAQIRAGFECPGETTR